MIEREKELDNIECYNTCVTLFKPSSTYDVHKVEACIDGRPLFDTTELIWVEEVVKVI